jgi:hypothetical protein
MTDYKNGKIYKITSTETDDVYIGSTCSTLLKRMSSHKSDYKRKLKDEKFRGTTSDNILKYANAIIELIENFPCGTKKELLDREGEITKNTPNCVNTQIQGRTMAEYREDNADKLKQQSADYREKNKTLINAKYKDWYKDWCKSDKGKAYYEQRKAKINVKVPCPTCNKEYSKSNLKRHMKTHE